ncbi:hypothetical protein MNEG_10125 [Monoraphidium neglectum]|uniref:Pentatricopeptide repeat-containing protein n=1 Tax=Monoraphidium neglectum TaxID=145388 RepID=A0A0D2KQD9_9CHLO|nr:hypothetical protein MNEG_10125 [Monoraphidium neglectum]KIY97838.1 hypothetical protein MNEG_10125 [Monoraphidium neglectum]|eukprot:XP_013896858.1 hypothetical protein MNEG_10125 [Monoraphidium neglectum]
MSSYVMRQQLLQRCACGSLAAAARSVPPPLLHMRPTSAAGRGSRRVRTPLAVLAEASQVSEEERIREVRAEATRRIKALGAQRKLKEAIQELAGLSRLGVQPDTQAGTALVAACAQSGNMEMAESVFEQLFGDFLAPDEVTFAVLLRGYGAKNPPQWDQIDAMLTRMRSRFSLEPSAVSFNALLEVCVRTEDTDRALDVIDRMADDGVDPDEMTIAVCSRKRQLRAYLRKRLA